MTIKDPHNTRERLTKALQVIATSSDAASTRAEWAWMEIMPLLEHEFPITAVNYYRYLKENAGIIINGKATDEEVKVYLKSIWDLYWEMSENIQFK